MVKCAPPMHILSAHRNFVSSTCCPSMINTSRRLHAQTRLGATAQLQAAKSFLRINIQLKSPAHFSVALISVAASMRRDGAKRQFANSLAHRKSNQTCQPNTHRQPSGQSPGKDSHTTNAKASQLQPHPPKATAILVRAQRGIIE